MASALGLKALRRLRRGIVLITTLAIMTFLVMLCTVLVTTGHSSLRRAATYSQSEQALQAAFAGLNYAQGAFERNLFWMTPDALGTYSVNLSGTTVAGNVTVTESNTGLVLGTLVSNGGMVSQFRISFNPSLTETRYISCNNTGLSVNGSALVHPDPTLPAAQVYRTVPPNMVTVIVEARVLSGSDAGASVVATRMVEGTFGRDMTQLADSVAFSGRDTQATLSSGGQWNVSSVNTFGSTSSGMRSMGNITMSTPDGQANAFNIGSTSLHLLSGNQAFMLNTTNQQRSVLGSGSTSDTAAASADRFPRVTSPEATLPANLVYGSIQQGTYVAWPNGNSARMEYYPDLSYTHDMGTPRYNADHSVTINGVTYQPSADGVPVSSAGYFQASNAENGHPAVVRVNINQPTKVTTAGGGDATQGLAILAADPSTALVNFSFSPAGGGTSPAVLKSTSSNIALEGDVVGTGSILAGGDVMVQGHSALAPSTNVGLSLYAGGNAYVDPLTSPAVGTTDTATLNVSVMTALASDAGITPGTAATATPTPTPDPAPTPGQQIQTGTSDCNVTYAGNDAVNISVQAGWLGGSGSHTFQSMPLPAPGTSVSQSYSTGFLGRRYTATVTNLGNGTYEVSTSGRGALGGLFGGNTSTSTTFAIPGAGTGASGTGNSGGSTTGGIAAPANSTGLTGTVQIQDIGQMALQLLNGPAPGQPGRTLAQMFGDAGYSPQAALGYVTTLLSKNATKESGQIAINLAVPAPPGVHDQVFYGMVYACHDFQASAGSDNSVTVQGVVVAYGGNPATYQPGQSLTYPGADSTGNLAMSGKYVNLIYDPTYLGVLARANSNMYVKSSRVFLVNY